MSLVRSGFSNIMDYQPRSLILRVMRVTPLALREADPHRSGGYVCSLLCRLSLRLRWYGFPISDIDKLWLHPRHAELVRLDNDLSGGFLRHYVTEYVEAHGKFSALLTFTAEKKVFHRPSSKDVSLSYFSPNRVTYKL